ncbi:MAG TPA: hypothetical protein VI365_11695 [Trebonia sp.]
MTSAHRAARAAVFGSPPELLTAAAAEVGPGDLVLREVLGSDRVMYAMDYPYGYLVNEVRWQDDLPVTAADKKLSTTPTSAARDNYPVDREAVRHILRDFPALVQVPALGEVGLDRLLLVPVAVPVVDRPQVVRELGDRLLPVAQDRADDGRVRGNPGWCQAKAVVTPQRG